MKKWLLSIVMIASQSFAEIPTQQVQPVFISVHISQTRVLRINTNQIRWYEDYYPSDDLYYGSNIYMVGTNSSISVIEKPDEIELMLAEGYQKPKPKWKK